MSSPGPLLPALLVAAYFLGNVSPGLLLARLCGRGDVRAQGSGGTGATNTGRLLGKKGFAAVLALDMAKGALATLLPVFAAALAPEFFGFAPTADAAAGLAAAGAENAAAASVEAIRMLGYALACGLSAVAGHVWPAMLGFRGGKGVGPFFGVWFAAAAAAWPVFWFAPLTLLTAVAGGVLLWPFLRRGAFLAALCALPAQPLCLCLLAGSWKPLPPALAMTFILLYAHRENFRRKRA